MFYQSKNRQNAGIVPHFRQIFFQRFYFFYLLTDCFEFFPQYSVYSACLCILEFILEMKGVQSEARICESQKKDNSAGIFVHVSVLIFCLYDFNFFSTLYFFMISFVHPFIFPSIFHACISKISSAIVIFPDFSVFFI